MSALPEDLRRNSGCCPWEKNQQQQLSDHFLRFFPHFSLQKFGATGCDLRLMIVPCIMAHASQLIIDSILAVRWEVQDEKKAQLWSQDTALLAVI